MGLILLLMTVGAAILTAQLVAFALFREAAAATQIVLPVVMDPRCARCRDDPGRP